MEARSYQTCTPEAYLEAEKVAEVRHEYLAGTVHAMAGASRRHNRIALSIATTLRRQVRGGPCEVYLEGVKVRIRTAISEFFYYPDAMVGCAPEDRHEFYLENPSLLFEVLSPSTDQIDRREKLLAYQTISSLDHYLIVSQDERQVERIRRDGATWTATVLEEPHDRLSFPKQGMELTLAEIYEGIQFGESIQASE